MTMEQLPKANVLLVDDIDANLVVLEALLGGMDCQLVRACTGNEALRHLLKREFAVILLDVQMPGMDGFEVARYARDNPSTREIPIIFLTAMHSSDENLLRGYGTGAQILAALGIHDMILLSNTHHSPVGLAGYGLAIVEERPIEPEA